MTAGVDVAVLGRGRDVHALAGAAAALLARRGAGLVLTTAPAGRPPVLGLPSTTAARRLRDRLRHRDLDAHAAGRVVWCRVDDAGARPALAAGAGAGAVVVLAIAGPRGRWTEPLLDDARLALIAGAAGDPLTALALADLRSRGVPAESVARVGGTATALARAGLAAPPSWEPRLRAALELDR